jgi:hypothetical protein
MNEAEWRACSDPDVMVDYASNKVSSRKLRLFGCACCRRIEHLLIDDRSRIAVKNTEFYLDDVINADELERSWDSAHKARLAVGEKCQGQCEALTQAIRRALRTDFPTQFAAKANVNSVPVQTFVDLGFDLAIAASEERATILEMWEERYSQTKLRGRDQLLSFLRRISAALDSGDDIDLRNAVEAARLASARWLAATAASRVAWGTQADWQEGLLAKSVARFAGEASNSVDEKRSQCALLREIIGDPRRLQENNKSPTECGDETLLAAAKEMYEKRDFDKMSRLGELLREAGCDDQEMLDHCNSGVDHVLGCWVLDKVLRKS